MRLEITQSQIRKRLIANFIPPKIIKASPNKTLLLENLLCHGFFGYVLTIFKIKLLCRIKVYCD